MIIANGSIVLGTQRSGGIATDGYATASTISWGTPIPCQYYANTKNNLGRTNGEAFVAASYVVLIEQRDVPQERIRILNALGATIGEFSIISTTQLDCVAQTQILV